MRRIVPMIALLLVSTVTPGVHGQVTGLFFQSNFTCTGPDPAQIEWTSTSSCLNVTEVNPARSFPTYRTVTCDTAAGTLTYRDSKAPDCDMTGGNDVETTTVQINTCKQLNGPTGSNGQQDAVGSYMYLCTEPTSAGGTTSAPTTPGPDGGTTSAPTTPVPIGPTSGATSGPTTPAPTTPGPTSGPTTSKPTISGATRKPTHKPTSAGPTSCSTNAQCTSGKTYCDPVSSLCVALIKDKGTCTGPNQCTNQHYCKSRSNTDAVTSYSASNNGTCAPTFANGKKCTNSLQCTSGNCVKIPGIGAASHCNVSPSGAISFLSDKLGLSTGATIAVAVVVPLAAIAMIIGACCYFQRRKKQNTKPQPSTTFDNHGTSNIGMQPINGHTQV